MRVPHLSQCCCGCKLETGALIIGWLNLIFSILFLAGTIMALVIPDNSPDNRYGAAKDNIDISVVLSALTVFCLSILLLIGANKRNDKYLNSWVIINSYVIALYIASYTANAVIVMIAGAILIGFLIILFGCLSCLLYLYFICVVHNLRREITLEKMSKANFPVNQNLLLVQ